jgi:plasmid stabilization system protein ParE
VYSIVIEPSAHRDIEDHIAYLEEHAHSPDYSERWYDSIIQAISGLSDFPFSFALSPENDEFEEELRHRIIGSYRILFTVTAGSVSVLHVRHGRQDVIRPQG